MGENTAGGSDSALIFLCHFSGHVKGDEMRQARYWTSRSWLYLCKLVRDGDANQLAGRTPTLVLLGSFDWTSWESQESNYKKKSHKKKQKKYLTKKIAGGTPTLVLLGSFDWTSWESQESNYKKKSHKKKQKKYLTKKIAGGTPTLVLLGSFDWTSWDSQESNYTLTPLPYIIYVLFHLCLKNPYQMSFAQNWEKRIDWSSSSDKSGSGIPVFKYKKSWWLLFWNTRKLDCFCLSMMTALLPQTQTYSNHWSHSSRGVFLTMYLQWEWEWEYPCHYICHQKLATWNSFLIWWECFQPITTFVLFCWTTDKSSCNVLKAHPTILRSLICDFFKIS